jgi:hypothetical protein
MVRIGSVLLVAGLAMGCSEHVLVRPSGNGNLPTKGAIEGRVCDPTGRNWLSDALAYTNIVDDDGVIVDVKRAYSDRDGYWTLPELDGDKEYTIYVQYQNATLHEETVFVPFGETVKLEDPPCFDPLNLDIALITGDYDDMYLVLEGMGFANYTEIDGGDSAALSGFLTNLEEMRQYDLIFFNGGHEERGVLYAAPDGTDASAAVLDNIRQYVAEGGALYASDWAYDVVERGWPNAVDFQGDDTIPDAAQVGDYDVVNAIVRDQALAGFLAADRIEIEYDLPVWPPILTVQEYVSTHVSGTVHYREGTNRTELADVPLLVSFSTGEGRVGYSTFRVAANQNTQMISILQYIMSEL